MDSSSPDPLPPDNLKALQSEDLYLYGLIGNPLTHSFSQKYFNDKFSKEKLRDHRYELWT
jgi:shikimate 5-dehydrogenase